MPVDIFHDPLLRQKPHLASGHSESGAEVDEHTTLEYAVLRGQLQDLPLSQILQDALYDFTVRKKSGQEGNGGVDAAGGQSYLLPLEKGHRTATSPNAPAAYNNATLERKVRIILSEILRVEHLATLASPVLKSSKWQWHAYPSEVFSSSSCVLSVGEIVAFLADAVDEIMAFSGLCHTLLRLPHGLWILGRVLVLHTRRVAEVCQYMMEQCNGNDMTDPASIFYGKVLLYLCHVFPSSALHVRHCAISRQKFFGLILSLTLQWHTKEEETSPSSLSQAIVDLFHKLLVSPKEEFRLWSSEKARLAATCGLAAFEECRVQLLIHAYKLLPDTRLELSDDADIRAVTSVLRLYIHLKESADLTLQTEEYRLLSKLATCRTTTLSTFSNQLVILGLSSFTLLPDILLDRTVENDLVEWIKWQLQLDVDLLDRLIPEGGTSLEVLLLLASHLRAGHYKNIAEMLSDCLGLKVSVKSNSTVRLKNLLFNEVFRDETLLRYTLCVPPTNNLNASFLTALPVNCVFSLLQNKTVTSYDSLIKDWILAQLRKCIVPLHPVMLQILALYAERTLPYLKKNPDGTEEYVSIQKPFRPTEICAIIYGIPEPSKWLMKSLRTVDLFNGRSDPGGEEAKHVPQILMAFYVLAYNNFYFNHLKTFMSAGSLNIQPYGMELMEKIPFKYYLALTLGHPELYDPLADILGRLMLEVLPQMRTVHDDMQTSFSSDEMPDALSAPFIAPAKVPDAGQSLSRYLDLLSRCPVDSLSTCMDDFLSLLPRLWDDVLPATTQDAFEKVWTRLAAVDSNTVFFSTTSSFLLARDKTSVPLTSADLCFEPLHILRSDAKLFRVGFLTRILLRIFTSDLTASKLYFSQQLDVVEQELMIRRKVDSLDCVRDEEKRAMFMLQESLAVQILIEQCVGPGTALRDFGLPDNLTESQTAICAFIHRLILANPTLAKLVIFQGFHLGAVPCIVRGVESLHISVDYLHEAMDLPSVTKKLFVLELTSCLCVKFRIGRTLVVARLAVDVISTMCIAYPSSLQPEIIMVGGRCLARIANVFPPLRQDCVAILQQMRTMSMSSQAISRQWRQKAKGLLRGGCSNAGSTSVALHSLLTRALVCASGQPPLSS